MHKSAAQDYMKMAQSFVDFGLDGGASLEKIAADIEKMGARLVHLKKGELIARKGDKAISFGLVIGGGLQMTVSAIRGECCVMRYIRPGQLAGHSLVLQTHPLYPCDVSASPFCDVIVFDLVAAQKWMKEDPFASTFLNVVIAQLELSLIMSWKRGFVVSQRTIIDRVMAYLMIRSGDCGSNEIIIDGTQDDLANYLACDRAAMNRSLSKLKADGYIRIERGKIVILKPMSVDAPPLG